MSERCERLQSRPDITRWRLVVPANGSDSLRCIRPYGHKGPHLVQLGEFHGRALVAWDDDLCPWGTCEFCDSEDPEENCLVFKEVALEEGRRLFEDGEYDPWEEE